MDSIAVISDIHGNLPALEAVFDSVERLGPSRIYCLGDLVGYGAFPNEVVDAIRLKSIPTVQGNYDRGVGNNSDDCGCAYTAEIDKERGRQSIAWTNAHVTDDNKAFLRALPDNIPLTLGDVRVALVHGSPRRVNEYLFENRPESGLERLLDAADADVLVCGHTHLPYHRRLSSGRQIVNVGSVGKPKDNNRDACYVVLSAVGSELTVEFVRVPYDVERAAQAIEAGDLPHAFADMLREGRG